MFKATLSLICIFFAVSAHCADNSDTLFKTKAQKDSVGVLQEIVVTAKVNNEIIPAQKLEGEALKKLNSNSVADALRYFSGVQVKDYGGVGGIKTVNIRSMGSSHTGVVYDGVHLGNAQNGQIDLGQFSLDNVEAISVYNGQKSEILQPARDFGNAGAVYLHTRTPQFTAEKRFNLRAAVRTGSFDLINPSVLFEYQFSKKTNAAVSAEWLRSSGKYKFRYKRVLPSGVVAYDTTAVRQNGDINALRVEANVNGLLSSGEWHAKIYHYNSKRGIPGAIVNNVWRRGERLWDNNSFAQGSFRKNTGRFSTLNNIKYAWYKTHYINDDDRQIKVDNRYQQGELYLSSANQYQLSDIWRISLSYDFIFNNMLADLYNFVRPQRYTNLVSVATALSLPRFKAQASLLGTFVDERRHGVPRPKSRRVATPAVYLFGNPLRNKDFSLRGFFKQSYRMPTFNDLYYTDMGNASLKPEKATQYNAGMVYEHTSNRVVTAWRISADAYYNRVKDKIVAYPKGQQFRWTMLNLGEVEIKGIDASSMVAVNPVDVLNITLRMQYTYQYAIDVTNAEDSYYRHQIPYVPRHSGSAVINADWRGWGLNYSFIYVGSRYGQQENILVNKLQPWYTNDLSLCKDFTLKKVSCRVLLEINNLLSQDYDVILNYPMPKRNYRLILQIQL